MAALDFLAKRLLLNTIFSGCQYYLQKKEDSPIQRMFYPAFYLCIVLTVKYLVKRGVRMVVK
jgi:hypothetical protein